MKKRLREAGRLLIAAVDDSQRALGTRQGVEPTGGDGMTMQCAVQIDLDVWVGVPQGITFYEGPSCDGVIRLCCAYFQATSSLAHWTRALSHGGHPLKHIVVDSTMGQMRVKAALAAIHAIEGHHLFSYGPVMGVWAKPKRKVVSEANSLLKDKRIKRMFFMENRFISPA